MGLLGSGSPASAQCGDPTAGSCCAPSETLGCADADCCGLVCAVDPLCCTAAWDAACVLLARDACDPLCADVELPGTAPFGDPQINAAFGIAVDWSPVEAGTAAPLLAVGSYLRNDWQQPDGPDVVNAGSVSIFRRIGGIWSPETLLYSTSGASDTYFGRSLAISEGPSLDVLAVGAYRNSQQGFQRGAVEVFTSSVTGVWAASETLRPGSGSVNNEWFGFSVDAGHVPGGDGDTIAIGAPRSLGSERGAVYLFRRDGKAWERDCKVVPLNSGSYDESRFGWAIGLQPNVTEGADGVPLLLPYKMLVIGAPGFNGTRGRVFVLSIRLEDTWEDDPGSGQAVPNKTLTLPFGLDAGDRYGESIATASRFIAAGLPGLDDGRGGVAVWERIGNGTGTGDYTYRTLITGPPGPSLPPAAKFGGAVSLREWSDGSVLLMVGSRGDDEFGNQSGSVHFFRWQPDNPASQWDFLGTSYAPEPEIGAQFGFSVTAGDAGGVAGAPFQNTFIEVKGKKPTLLNNAGAAANLVP
ncbi:MAG: hypothetical protein ACO3QA_08440 [Phycisphaerales bacterium]